eukprot:6475762-Amphidinium_carterae.1
MASCTTVGHSGRQGPKDNNKATSNYEHASTTEKCFESAFDNSRATQASEVAAGTLKCYDYSQDPKTRSVSGEPDAVQHTKHQTQASAHPKQHLLDRHSFKFTVKAAKAWS